MSKLARVTEELEALVNPTASIVHEEEEEEKEKESSASIQQEELTVMKIIEPEESIVLPQIPTPITTTVEEEKKVDIVTIEVSY